MRFRAWLHKQGFRHLIIDEFDLTASRMMLIDFASDEDASRYSFSEAEDKVYNMASTIQCWGEIGWDCAKNLQSDPAYLRRFMTGFIHQLSRMNLS